MASPKESGRVKEENSINSRHGRRVAKKLVVVLAERVRKVDVAAADGRELYGAGAGYGEVIEEMNERERERLEIDSLLQRVAILWISTTDQYYFFRGHLVFQWLDICRDRAQGASEDDAVLSNNVRARQSSTRKVAN